VKEQAQREADLILSEARSEARAATRRAEAERERLRAETRRVEALLRAALGLLEEGAGNDAGTGAWAGEGEGPADGSELEPEPAHAPQLANVSSLPLFGWGDEKEA
jgi:cell division septum initiation protein DivIVA